MEQVTTATRNTRMTHLCIDVSFLGTREERGGTRKGDQSSNQGATAHGAVQEQPQAAPGRNTLRHELGAHGFIETAAAASFLLLGRFLLIIRK